MCQIRLSTYRKITLTTLHHRLQARLIKNYLKWNSIKKWPKQIFLVFGLRAQIRNQISYLYFSTQMPRIWGLRISFCISYDLNWKLIFWHRNIPVMGRIGNRVMWIKVRKTPRKRIKKMMNFYQKLIRSMAKINR